MQLKAGRETLFGHIYATEPIKCDLRSARTVVKKALGRADQNEHRLRQRSTRQHEK